MEENNDVNREPEGFVVSGYTYETKEGAALAREELEAIRYLSSKADYKDIRQVYKLYNTVIDRKLFKTQVGMDYLKKLQQHLYNSKAVPDEMIRPIPINLGAEQDDDEKRTLFQQKGTIQMLKKSVGRYKGYLVRSVLLNIILLIVIAAMLIISATSTNPTIFNYESKLQDRYSSWEEELNEREKAVKKREAQLGIR